MIPVLVAGLHLVSQCAAAQSFEQQYEPHRMILQTHTNADVYCPVPDDPILQRVRSSCNMALHTQCTVPFPHTYLWASLDISALRTRHLMW